VLADPIGPTCHKGTESCFADAMPSDAQRLGFLALLENIIANRIADQPESSYTAKLYAKGTGRIAQKVGEEGVETALAAVSRDDEGLVSECADLLFHLMVLLKSRELTLERIVEELKARHASKG
jgi:phosphoribosyl-ATP pyrophosphohydrolase/phosphoribosyl-AMP cyclohydrolase